MTSWPVQDAKTKLSQVMARARVEGPQFITRHGAEHSVVLSIEEYRSLTTTKPDFKAYLLSGPKFDDFSIERDKDTGRLVDI